MVIFFSGLPKAGKSITLAALYRRLAASGKRFFLERACPDCEGIWTSETSNGGDMARKEKNAIKASGQFFSPAFVEAKCQAIANLARFTPLLLVDMGGIPSGENRRFANAALSACGEVTAVILHRPQDDPLEWRSFWKSLGIAAKEVVADYQEGESWQEAAERFAGKVL